MSDLSKTPVKKKKNQSKKRGLKKRKRLFEETKLGFFIQHEAPLEYRILRESFDLSNMDVEILAKLIESISYSSGCKLFRKTKFRLALIEFREYGYYAPKIIKNSVDKELYYMRIRKTAGSNLLNKGWL